MLARQSRVLRFTETVRSFQRHRNPREKEYDGNDPALEDDALLGVVPNYATIKISPNCSQDVCGDVSRISNDKNSKSFEEYYYCDSKPNKNWIAPVPNPLLMGHEFSSDTSGDGPDKNMDDKNL